MLPTRKADKKGRGQSVAYRAAPKHEARIAAQHGGRVTRGSGNQGEKGDVRVPGKMRIECKATGAKSFSVTIDMMEKVENAVAAGELPLLNVCFVDASGKPIKSCYVVPDYAMDEFLAVYRGKQ